MDVLGGSLMESASSFDPHQGLLNLVDEPQQLLPGPRPGASGATTLFRFVLPVDWTAATARHSVIKLHAPGERRRQLLWWWPTSCLRRNRTNYRIGVPPGGPSLRSVQHRPAADTAAATSGNLEWQVQRRRPHATATAIRSDLCLAAAECAGVPQGIAERAARSCGAKPPDGRSKLVG